MRIARVWYVRIGDRFGVGDSFRCALRVALSDA